MSVTTTDTRLLFENPRDEETLRDLHEECGGHERETAVSMILWETHACLLARICIPHEETMHTRAHTPCSNPCMYAHTQQDLLRCSVAGMMPSPRSRRSMYTPHVEIHACMYTCIFQARTQRGSYLLRSRVVGMTPPPRLSSSITVCCSCSGTPAIC